MQTEFLLRLTCVLTSSEQHNSFYNQLIATVPSSTLSRIKPFDPLVAELVIKGVC